MHDFSSGTDAVETLFQRLRNTSCFEYDIGIRSESFIVCNVHHAMGPEFRGDCERAIRYVADADFRTPGSKRADDDEAANRPSAVDHHTLSLDIADSLHRMQRDCEGFGC